MMPALSLDQILHMVAWGVAQIEIILALYVFLLNVRHASNRYISAMFLLFAVNNIAVGWMLDAQDIGQAHWATTVVAVTAPAIQPFVLMGTVALLRPELLRSRWRWLVRLTAITPLVLTLVDVYAGTGFWYTGLDPHTYAGGFVPLSEYAAGRLAPLIRVLVFYLISLVTLALVLHVALDKKLSLRYRRIGWVLFVGMVVVAAINVALRRYYSTSLTSIVSSVFFILVYGYAAFQQLVSERRMQRGSLPVRLTLIIIAITVPLFLAVTYSFMDRARTEMRRMAVEQLRVANHSLESNASAWLDFNVSALRYLVSMPDIVSMDPVRQKPVLEAMAAAYPHMYLVSTTDLSGVNVARSDDVPPKDYHDRAWFQGAAKGELTFQTLIGRTSGKPALVAALPIRDESGAIIGVGMFATDLDSMAHEVQASHVGETGLSYLVDSDNKVIAHPDPAYANELRDLSDYPPVQALRSGWRGQFTFEDADGRRWWAYLDDLSGQWDANWGVIVQQQESEWLAGLRGFQFTVWGIAIVNVIFLGLLTFLAVRQAFMPLHPLMETVTAITSGDLERVAPVESEDEIGLLARAFNQMTERLRELIGNLETRVRERTAALERRTRYLEASAQVARDAASVLDPQLLLDRAVRLIGEQFGFYHIGLFLMDESGQWAVLQAASSTRGRRLLQKGHRVPVGEGVVGYVAGSGTPRVIHTTEHPQFPKTRSELALPLQARGEIIGVLDVHSTDAEAFEEEVAVLRSLADQIALAISNARLFQQAQRALEAERRAYGEFISQEWAEMLREWAVLGYICDAGGVRPVTDESPVEDASLPEVAFPIVVRGREVGTLLAHKPAESGEWTEDEVRLMKSLVEQVGVALEGAQLYRDTRLRAARERLIGEVTGRLRESLDMETVARRAVQELSRALGMESVTLYLRVAEPETGAETEDE